MTPDSLDSNPISCPSLLIVLMVLQCQQSEVQAFGKMTLVQGMTERLLLILVWGNIVPPSPYPATLRYLGKTVQILSM
jgi:hypothetical protein